MAPLGQSAGYTSGGYQPLQGSTSLQPLNSSLQPLQPLNSSSQFQTLPPIQGSGLPAVAENQGSQPTPSTQAVPVGQVIIQEIKVEGLKLKDAVCKNAICTCDLGSHSKWTSPPAKNVLNPAWAPNHGFEKFNHGDALSFTIADKASWFGQTQLGKISLAFEKFFPGGYYGKVRLSDGVKDAKPVMTVKILVKPIGDSEWRVPAIMESPPDLEPLVASTDTDKAGASGGTSTKTDVAAVHQLLGPQTSSDVSNVHQLMGGASQETPLSGVNSSLAPLNSNSAPLVGPTGVGAGLGSTMTSVGMNSSSSPNPLNPLIGPGQTGVGTGLGTQLLGPSIGQTDVGTGLGMPDGKNPPVFVPSNAFALKETQQKEGWEAVNRWLRYWSLRRSTQMDPAREKNKALLQGIGQPGVQDQTAALLQGPTAPAQDRMFVFRLRNAFDISIPLLAEPSVPKARWGEVRKAAEKEAIAVLSLRLRFSFLDDPAGVEPALCGHSMVSPKLRIQKAEAFQADAAQTSCFSCAPAGGLGKLNVTASCDQLPPFFFCSKTTGSDRQLVVEVLAEMEPLVVPVIRSTQEIDSARQPGSQQASQPSKVDTTTITERSHTILAGESIRVRADGWLRSPEKGSSQLGGGIAFIVDLKTASGNIALRWAPLLNGEHVMRNALVNNAWSTPDMHGGWPHHSIPPAPGGQGGPVLLDFRRTNSGWEVWVDGNRQPDFDFQDRTTPIDVVNAEFSRNLLNPQVYIIPSLVMGPNTRIDPRDKLAQGTTSRTQYLRVPKRQWSVDSGAVATARPKSAPRGKAAARTTQNVRDKSISPTDLVGTQEPVTVGWMCVRFDNATETFSMSKEQLILGSLHEWLMLDVDPITGQPKPSTNKLQDYLQRVKGQRSVGGMDYELLRIQISPVAQKLLPRDFPACVGMARLGGISSNMDKGFLALSAADETECLLKDLCVTFPDGTWLEDFKKAVEFNVNGKMDRLSGDQKEVQELCLKVGSHNCLRWLDVRERDPNTGLERRLPGMAPDESQGTWKLNLENVGQQSFMFRGGNVPLEFTCDVDCAIVFELVAKVVASKPGSPQKKEENQTIGWLLLLPLVHTTEEALQKAADIHSRSAFYQATVQYNMELMQQIDPISGQKAFKWKPVAAGQQPLHNAVRISFSISSDSFVKWLQRKCTPTLVPEELKPKPRSQSLMQPSLLPGSSVGLQTPDTMLQGQLGAKTSDLLWKPPTQEEKDRAAASGLAPPTQIPSQFPGQIPSQFPVQIPSQTPLPQQPPWVHQVTPQPGLSMSPPPELQTVVERIYLRDQGTQSDPPPLPGIEDCVIGAGRPLPAAAVAAITSQSSPEKASQAYTGPSMRPLPGGMAARLIQDVGDAGASAILRGISYLKTAGGPRREMRWRLEDDDPLQADEITVEFLAYRSFSNVSSDRVHFQLRFFVFPPLKTSSAVLAGGVGEACMLRSAVTNDRLALVYNIDGATKGSASQVHRQLAEYLAARSAEVEVWSTDWAMQVGAATVSLEPLVRQGQQVTKVEGEFPVLDPLTGETRGSLQLLLACRGRTPARAVPGLTQQPLQTTQVTSMMPEVSEMGTSMAMPAGSATAAVREVQAERGRIRRHKAQVLLGTTPAPTAVPSAVDFLNDTAKKRHRLKQLRMMRGSSADITERFAEHTALLSAAEEVRADRKRAEVARRMDRFNTSQIILPAVFANSAFFHVEFANPYSQQATFVVSITEPQKPPGAVGVPTSSSTIGVPSNVPQSASANFQGIMEQAPEEVLSLVKDPLEWQRIVAERKVPPPPSGEYGIFSAVGHFSLRPGEATSLPFRYLAFNHPSLASVAQQAPVGGMGLLEAEAQGLEVPDRIFVVEVLVYQGPPLKRVEVTARAQPCVIDKTVRFFEAEGEPLEKSLALPVRPAATGFLRGTSFLDNQSTLWQQSQAQAGFVSASVGRTQDRFVYCTDKSVHLQWKDEDTLQLRMLTPISPTVKRFFVLCYADANFMRVGSAQLVEVHSMKCEHIRVCVGQSVDRTISLPPVELLDTLTVQAFSSDPDLVAVRHAADVDPRYGAKLGLAITAMRAGTRTCRLHAVDPMTRRRIAAFLIVVAADMPDVRVAHDITLSLNRPARKHLKYTNETMRPLRYTVKSSDPALATVQTPELMLPPGDTRVIELLFHAYPGTMSYSAEVYLFIASEDRAIQETRLLQLTYT